MPLTAAAFAAGLLIHHFYAYFPLTLSVLLIAGAVICMHAGLPAKRLFAAVFAAAALMAYQHMQNMFHPLLGFRDTCFFYCGMAHAWRIRLVKVIYESLSGDSAGILSALITGFRGGISGGMRDAFNATGLAHLLSISGTHFGLLAVIIFSSTRFALIRMPERLLNVLTIRITPAQIAACVTLPLLGLYLIVSGAGVPALRAMIMTVMYMAALAAGRKGRWIHSMSAAALLILIWRPSELFGTSFMLSFTAVLSIGLIMDRRVAKETAGFIPSAESRGALDRLRVKSLNSALITVAVTLGTAPVVVSVFGSLPLYAVLINIIITPLVCFLILPAGLLSSAAAAVFHLHTLPMNKLIDGVTLFVLQIIKYLSWLPMSRIYLQAPAPIVIVMYYPALLAVLLGNGAKKFIPLALTAILYLALPLMHSGGLTVTFIDVGQGDSSLVELPGGRIMLVDGGSKEAGSGRRRIAPFLRSKWIGTIDYLVISHNHPDHTGGLEYIVDNFRIKEVWMSGRNAEAISPLIKKIIKRHIPIRLTGRGDYLDLESCLVTVLHPFEKYSTNYGGASFTDENNASLVLKIESAGGAILLAGDIQKEAERELMPLGNMLRADVIKVPHHGSRTSASPGFIDLVRPEDAVISVGRKNPFGHPHDDTVQMYKDRGIRVFRTDRDGSVTVSIRMGHGISVRTSGGRRFRKVNGIDDELENLISLMK